MTNPDDDIINAYETDSHHAMGLLFDRYKLRVFNFCLRLLDNRADAEEVTGLVFLSLFSQKTSYDKNVKFAQWIFTHTFQGCQAYHKKQRGLWQIFRLLKKDSNENTFKLSGIETESQNSVEDKQKFTLLKKAMTSASFEIRAAYILKEIYGFTYKEIEKIVGIPVEEVQSDLFKLRKNLLTNISFQ